MQVPRLVKEFQQNKVLLERYGQKYTLSEFVRKDLRQFKVAVEVPQNVFSKQSWSDYARTHGVSFATGVVVAGTTLVLINSFIKRKIRTLKTKRALKKTGQL